MIYSQSGTVAFEGDYPTLLSDLLLVLDEFTEMSESLMENDDRVKPILKDAFETFPTTVTNFTKMFVKVTH